MKKIKVFSSLVFIPIIFFAGLTLITAIIMLIVEGISGLSFDDFILTDFYTITMIFSYLSAMCLAFLWTKKCIRGKTKPEAIHKSSVNIKIIFCSAIIGFSTGVSLTNIAIFLFPSVPCPGHIDVTGIVFLTFLSTVIIAPITEELVYRKFIVDVAQANNLPLPIYFILSALPFAMSHSLTNIVYLFVAFFAGVIYVLLYYKTKNIIYPIIMHMANNLFAFFDGLNWYNSDFILEFIASNTFTYICYALSLLSIVLFLTLTSKKHCNSSKGVL